MGKGGQTIGFHYYMSLLFGLSRGPANELVEIQVGDKVAWQGSATDDSVQAIQNPNLFGGEKKEGGVQGPFRLFQGRFDQVLPGAGTADCGFSKPYGGPRTLPDVKTTIGGLISEFRGVLLVWFDGLISSMNPYPKEWKFRLRRYSAGWYNDTPWYPVLSRILMGGGTIHAMNPAHIIYQCLTDPSWGRGLPASLINENSFLLAANTLCDEGFGLCLLWQRNGTDISEFMLSVQEHIAAEKYLDPETGLMTLKLLRDDYVAEDLPLFTPTSGLLEITEDDSSSQDATFNEMIGTGHDPVTNQDFMMRAYNNAARQSQGAPNAQRTEYPGIPTRELLARVLQRDLKLHAAGLKKFNVTLDRRGWRIRQGMCFRIQDTRREIDNIILRAVEITDNAFKSGRIEIKAMQDVYGLPATSFVEPVETTWQPPSTDAIPAAAERLFEANYRDLRVRLSAATIADSVGEGVIATVALSPNPVMHEYDLATKVTGEADYVVRNNGAFTGAATLLDPIGPYDTVFTLTGITDFNEDLIGQAVLCEDEEMAVVDFDAITGEMTVKRGVADTIPAAHAAAATVWTVDDDAISDGRDYALGETVDAKVLTRAVGDVLLPSEASELEIVVVGRLNMPYPPGDVRVDGDQALTLGHTVYPEPEITWVHRDRLFQDDQLVGHEEAGIGPEAGTTYNIRLYDIADPMGPAIRTETAIAGTSWTYLSADQTTDGDPIAVWVELESERDALISYQHYRFLMYLKDVFGYGYGYGQNYGGEG